MKKKTGKTANTDGGVKKDNEEQSSRFIDMAEELGYDKKGKGFKDVIDSVQTDGNADEANK